MPAHITERMPYIVEMVDAYQAEQMKRESAGGVPG
jgi:hypothetical protein